MAYGAILFEGLKGSYRGATSGGCWRRSRKSQGSTVKDNFPAVIKELELLNKKITTRLNTLSAERQSPLRVSDDEAGEDSRPSPGVNGGLLDTLGTAGNLTTDAHLAAQAIEYRAEIASTDNDFARFKGLRWFNPIKV